MFDETRFRETFDQVRANPALLTEVLTMTQNEKQTKHAVRRISRTVLIAAVVACMLTITAFAGSFIKAYMDSDGMVVDAFFGNRDFAHGDSIVRYDDAGQLEMNLPAWSKEPLDLEVAQRLVEPYLYTIEENSWTVDGYTYTIHAILYDTNTNAMLIRWSVENPDGLGKYSVAPNGAFSLPGDAEMLASCGGRDYLDTANSTDTKLYISSFDVDYLKEYDKEYECTFGRWYDLDKGVDGEWYDAKTVTIPRSDRGGMTALQFGEDITLSPVAIQIRNIGTDDTDIKELTVCYQDGTKYDVFSDANFFDNTTYALISTEGGYVTYTFNRIVDVDRVSAIMLNGTEYPVA